MNPERLTQTKKQISKAKFDLIRYCRKKLSNKNIHFIESKALHMCKHKVIISKYNEVFSSVALDDYNSYLSAKKDKQNAYIYVVGNKEMGVCKIGFSNNVFKRLTSIQTGCPFKLEIFCVVYGSVKIEKMLHKKYDYLRLNGEWFKYEGLLKESLEKTESVIKDLFLTTKRK